MTYDELDEEDSLLRDAYIFLWNMRKGPRVGDAVIFPDGHVEYFSYEWAEGLQTSKGGSFCIHYNWVSFSGALNPSIRKDKLTLVGEYENRGFWLFHHGCAGAGRGRGFTAPVRLFKYEE